MTLGEFGLELLTGISADPTLFMIFLLAVFVGMLVVARASYTASALVMLAFLWAAGQPPTSPHGAGWGEPFAWFFWIVLLVLGLTGVFNLFKRTGGS